MMHSVKDNVMPYHIVTLQNHHSFFDTYITWSAQHFETDLNLYKTEMVDYTIINDSLVGFIDIVYMLKTYI